MKRERIYLDHNATAPLRPEAMSALVAGCDLGNPSSVHAEGRGARAALEGARRHVAALVGAHPAEIVFTSGGTEANNTALRPGALLDRSERPVERLLVGATEHPSALAGHGFSSGCTDVLAVDEHGRVELGSIESALRADPRPALVCIQAANGETGVIQPLEEVAALIRRHGAALHVDAVQAAGRVAFDWAGLGATSLALSAHKLGGPRGAGALVVETGRAGPNLPLLAGGGQEDGRRAGTQNVAAIAAFGAAADLAGRELPACVESLRRLRDSAEAGLFRLAPGLVVFGAFAQRLPNTSFWAIPGLSAETVLMALDLDGVAVSTGSACSSGRVGRSSVLAAMGVTPALAAGAVRLSFGWSSGARDVERLLEACERLFARLYRSKRACAA